MERRSLFGLLAATVAGIRPVAALDTKQSQIPLVSLIQLLARPDGLRARVVMTAGYLAMTEDGADLYLHREDHEACLLPNSLHVRLSPTQRDTWKALHRTHVAIKARFTPGGRDSTQGGSLDAVQVMDAIPPRQA